MITKQQAEASFDELVGIFDDTCENTLPLVELSDIILTDALKNQITLELTWNSVVGKIKTLKSQIDMIIDEAYSDAITKELKDSYRSTSISEAREFAKTDKTYRDFRGLSIEVNDLYEEAKGILDTIHSRRYVLNNITNSAVASVDKTIL